MKIKLKLPFLCKCQYMSFVPNGFMVCTSPSNGSPQVEGEGDLLLLPVEQLLSRVENFFSIICNPYWWHKCAKMLVRIVSRLLPLPQTLQGPVAVVLLCILWKQQIWTLWFIHLGYDSFNLFILSISSSNIEWKKALETRENKGRKPIRNIWMARVLKGRYLGSPLYCLGGFFLFNCE